MVAWKQHYISYISYFKHIYIPYKFNESIVSQFICPVIIKACNKLLTNKLDIIYTSDYNKLSKKLKIIVTQLSQH